MPQSRRYPQEKIKIPPKVPPSEFGFHRTALEEKRLEILFDSADCRIEMDFIGSLRKRQWRRERDSNPRCPFEHNGFQDRRYQPLTHPSAAESGRRSLSLSQLVRRITGTALPDVERPEAVESRGACLSQLEAGIFNLMARQNCSLSAGFAAIAILQLRPDRSCRQAAL